MFDQIREPRRTRVNRTMLLASVAVALLAFGVIGFACFWVLAELGIVIGPDPLGPVEVWYDPYEDGTEPP